MIYPIIVVATTIFISCSKEKDISSKFIDINIDIDFVDNKGESITKQLLDQNGLTLFEYKENNKIPIFKPNLDAKNGYTTYTTNNNTIIRIFPPLSEGLKNQKILLQFNENTIDTLDLSYINSGNSMYCKSVLYNSSLVWDVSSEEYRNKDRIIKIVKSEI
ncbi:hypothetical protein ORI89_04045 [Sphingobacterium sp. UT-1RO-CII-1]|uniref:hypothetical protein n=1 Tax=Sphingobacterium sp. UT-1RO-CII-1 TaxID=2995225 RepID=UPI00227B5ABF|nr:hypothetical protein [Sphingobacterium sp. UT-1RO-CII-1]MCY4778811.1 hypothetical protein [Sphingobacterium sp. UT-1RO-CII-1]